MQAWTRLPRPLDAPGQWTARVAMWRELAPEDLEFRTVAVLPRRWPVRAKCNYRAVRYHWMTRPQLPGDTFTAPWKRCLAFPPPDSVAVGSPVYLTDAVNFCHVRTVNLSVTPSRSLVSRTITPSAEAASTQLPLVPV